MSLPWTHPLPPFERDVARWAAFCASVVVRIQAIRREEPDDWRAFGRPLPERVAALCLPIGKVAAGPPPRSRTTQAS